MNDFFNLEGKNIILTGSAGILGRKFARAFHENGANLFLVDIDEEALKKQRKSLEGQSKGQVSIFSIDLTDENQVEKCVESIANQVERIDVLHNHAATKGKELKNFLRPFEEYTLESWNEIMLGNVASMFLMAKAVGKYMQASDGGSIIQTSSIYGIIAPDKRIYEESFYNNQPISSPAVYSASKAAVIGLSQYLAAYWGEKKIRVNTLTPGGIKSGQNDIFEKKYSYRVPLGRMATESDLLGAAIFLASDASLYVTGQNIIVDGGLSCW